MIKMYLPIAERISQWNTMTEILYKCPKCESSFAILGSQVKYCFNCGIKINWKVYDSCPDVFAKLYHHTSTTYEIQQEMMIGINKMNKVLNGKKV